MSKNNPIKGKKAEKQVAKGLGAVRVAGPNNTDVVKGSERIEVKNYIKPLSKGQLQKAYAQNKAQTVVAVNGFSDEAIEHAKKNMPTVQLREGKQGKKIVKRRG